MTDSTSDIEGYPCESCNEFVPAGEDHGRSVDNDEGLEDEWLCADCYGMGLEDARKKLEEETNNKREKTMIKRILEIQSSVGGYLPCQVFIDNQPVALGCSADDPRFQRIFITQPDQCEMCEEDMEMRIELTVHQIASLIEALQEVRKTLDERLDARGNQ